MTKNPFINALAAGTYIALVASLMFYGSRMFETREETIIMPIAMISLFTLSAAVMGYMFLYQPLQMYLDGNKKHAANLFLQTVAVFACVTVIFFLLMLSGIV